MNIRNLTKRSGRSLLLALCMAPTTCMLAQTNIVRLTGPETINSGKDYVLAIDLQNETPMVAFEAHINFPEGFEPVIDSDRNEMSWLSSRGVAGKHVYNYKWKPANRELTIVCFSLPITEFRDAEGPICHVNFRADENLSEGNYQIGWTGAKFVLDKDGETVVPYEAHPYNFNLTINTAVDTIEPEETVEAETDAFNTVGQKVTENYQGIVIKNGSKNLKK